MSSPPQPRPVYRFSVFELDARSGELRRNGSRLKVQDQPLQILLKLLEHADGLVTREELCTALWPADTFVDFDNGLNMAMKRLREVLGDIAERPTFIATVPRHGYRFIAPVEKPSSQVPSPRAPEPHLERLTTKAGWILVGATLLALLSGIGIWWFSRKSAESQLLSGEVLPVSGQPGFQAYPALSPDGNQVAFVIEGVQDPGIYTTLVGGEKPLRLTSNPGDSSPTWSPDGAQIAFTRFSINPRQLSICVIPALGGTEHKLYTFAYRPPSTMEWLNWSPTGKVLAFTESSRIQLLSIADSTTRPLTSPPERSYDYGPVFSPDGSTVAFVRGGVAGVDADLFVVPAVGGEAKRLTFDNREIDGPPAWTPDGRDIVFSSPRRGLQSLWRISASGGTPRQVPGVVMAFLPSISRKGDLAYLHQLNNDNIWQVSLKDETHPQGPPAPVISARWENLRPQFSPDGKQIAFESDRSGHSEIWACDSDGSNCGQVTSLGGTAGAARWSPNGHYVAFEFHPKEQSEIYVVEVPGGRPRLVPTFPGADNGAPGWSRDGQWIYFSSDHEKGPFQLWKVPLKGGPPVRVTTNGGLFGAESVDGSFLYYSKPEVPGIWKRPLDGGEETRVLDQPWGSFDWALVRNGIYLLYMTSAVAGVDPADPAVTTPPPGKSNIGFFEFATGKTILISSLDKPFSSGLAVSPNGRSILFVRNELSESSIMLVKNFQ